jgi:hypothetical protein
MSAEEIKAEEDKLHDVAKYVKESAMNNLIKNLQRNEGTPTDSKTLSEFFHQNGINMRYLGQIADTIKDKNLVHMKFLLEREVIVRCMKHILNKYLRDCESGVQLANTVSHLFNCLFAPKEFLKRLDDGIVSFNGASIRENAEKNLLENIKKLDGPSSAAEAAQLEVEK